MNVFWIAVLLFLILLCGVASIIDDRRHIKELEEEIDEEDLDTSSEIEIMMDEPSKGYIIKHGDMSILFQIQLDAISTMV